MSADSRMGTSWEVCGYHCSQLWGPRRQHTASIQEDEHGTAWASQAVPPLSNKRNPFSPFCRWYRYFLHSKEKCHSGEEDPALPRSPLQNGWGYPPGTSEVGAEGIKAWGYRHESQHCYCPSSGVVTTLGCSVLSSCILYLPAKIFLDYLCPFLIPVIQHFTL